MRRYWAISSFEPSGDRLAASFLAYAPKDIVWVGYHDRCYDHFLTHQIILPRWAVNLYGAVGLFSVFMRLARYFRLIRFLVKILRRYPLEGVVLVDFGGFHLRLLKRLKRCWPDLKVCYVAPPQTWATRYGRNKWIKKLVDICVVFYSFQQKFFVKQGIRCVLFKNIDDNRNVLEGMIRARRRDRTNILIYPGSRLSELKRHMPVVEKAVQTLLARGYSFRAYVSVAPHFWRDRFRWFPRNLCFQYFCEEAMPIVHPCVAWTCSGTMTGKIADLGIPMIVMYGSSRLMVALVRSVLRYKGCLGMPNIVLGQEVFPELLGHFLTPKNLVDTHLELLDYCLKDFRHYEKISRRWATVRNQGMSWYSGVPTVLAI